MYTIRLKDLAKLLKGFSSSNRTGSITTFSFCILVVLLLLISGLFFRILANRFKIFDDTPIFLPVSLNSFPSQIGQWNGTDLPIDNNTKKYMQKYFADDFLIRRYINKSNKAWADLYIVYCSSKPGGILGHRPGMCYPAHGWIHESTETLNIISNSGRFIPCLIHRFRKPAPTNDQLVVVNFYIMNGITTNKEGDFHGPTIRGPNLARNPSRYIAQIQISSVLENSVLTAAKDMTDLILDFFPDKNGKVRAAEFSQASAPEVITKLLSGN